jgi:hypothetical protein
MNRTMSKRKKEYKWKLIELITALTSPLTAGACAR